MPLSFPGSPSVGQTSVQNGRSYTWSGYAWEITSAISDGNKGDITVSSSGASWVINAGAVVTADIANSAVTDAKIASVGVEKVTGLAAVATTGSAADLSGTLADARLSPNVPRLPSLLLRTSNENASIHLDTVPRTFVGFQGLTLTSGTIIYVFFTPAANLTVSQISMASGGTAAAGLTLARMGIFTFDETTVTLVAQTASDTTLFAATRTIYTRSLNTTGGFPATYTLQAGTRYGVGLICIGTTMPAVAGNSTAFELLALSPKISASRFSQADLGTTAFLGSVSVALWARLS